MAKKESTQRKLSRVRPPRVHITYEVELGEAIQQKNIPFVVGVLGDFSGQPAESSSLFLRGDLKDAAGLAAKLQSGKDPVSQHLYSQLDEETRGLLKEFDDSGSKDVPEPLRRALVNEFNRLIKGASLFDEQRFKLVKLSGETQQLIGQNPKGVSLVRLNRLLLEDAYTQEITRSPTGFRFKDRKFIEINRDNFDQVLAGMRPRLAYRVDNTLAGDGSKLNVELSFDSLESFEPDNLVQQVEPLRRLIEARRKLADLRSKMDGNDRLEEMLQEIIQNTEQQQALSKALGLDAAQGSRAGENGEAGKEARPDEQE
jgi:type VI secretion system ImpB/VipA family protein